MKLFTVSEANELIPVVKPMLLAIRDLYERLSVMKEYARAAAASSELSGGMEGGSNYVKILYQIGKLTTELHTLGVELKDYERGLVDFPSRREDRIVLLCWQLGEADHIEWWHERDAGFAGRQPL